LLIIFIRKIRRVEKSSPEGLNNRYDSKKDERRKKALRDAEENGLTEEFC
jgi:hypothetical protein